MSAYKIAITGGSGFVGSSLAEHLSNKFDIRILDKTPPSRNLREGIEYQKCDIRDRDAVERGLADVDLVIHAAIVQIPLINERKRLGYEVNVRGTQNVCEAVNRSPSAKGMILTGSWHLFGEHGLSGVIDEGFGFRPDKVEDRARLYTFSKIIQETIVRFYDEMSEKIYGVVRLGTVLGEGMPEKTAANLFITRGLKGEPLTPYKHSMHRPMLYVDIEDVCRAFEVYSEKILKNEIPEEENSLAHVVNLCYPEPITILELANTIRDTIVKLSGNKIVPKIEIVDTGALELFTVENKHSIRVDIRRAAELLGLKKMNPPRKSVERIVKKRLSEATL